MAEHAAASRLGPSHGAAGADAGHGFAGARAAAARASHAPIPARFLSQPGEPAERRADARAHGAPRSPGPHGSPGPEAIERSATLPRAALSPSGHPAPSPTLPAGLPGSIRARAGHGHPLAPALQDSFGRRLGGAFTHVRVHSDDAAAALAEAAGARAFTAGSNVFFNRGEYRPDTASGRELLAHELSHVAEASSAARIWRQPKADATATKTDASELDAPEETWARVQVFSDTMDHAALVLAGSLHLGNKRNPVFIGLSSRFFRVYDNQGRPLGERLTVKKDVKLHFVPGIYGDGPNGLVAFTQSTANPGAWGLERDANGTPRSIVATRAYTDAERAEQAKASAKAAAAHPDPSKGGAADAAGPSAPAATNALTFDVRTVLDDPAALAAQAALVSNAVPIYFVPEPPAGGASSGAGGGSAASIPYATSVEGRGDGKAPNAPPWPVSVTGLKLAPVNSDPTFSAKVDWSANGNWSVASQALTQVGESIHYRWERFDVTRYARQTADEARTENAAARPEIGAKNLNDRLNDATHAAATTGEDVTGMGGADYEFNRAFSNWWKDTKRAGRGVVNPDGDTVGERFSNAIANQVSLETMPASLILTTLGAALSWVAELFAGPRQQQEIPFPEEGVFLIRVITTPGINVDRDGNKVIRPPSVASKIIEIRPMDHAVREALDEPGAQLAELQSQIDLADHAGNIPRAAYLRRLLRDAELQFGWSPLALDGVTRAKKSADLRRLIAEAEAAHDSERAAYFRSALAELDEPFDGSVRTLLMRKRDAKAAQLKEFQDGGHIGSDYTLTQELDTIDRQIQRFDVENGQRVQGATERLAEPVRVNATLISEVTGEQYPLLLSAGPMAKEGTEHRWMILDTTNPDADAVTGTGATPSLAFAKALKHFGEKAGYGRGRIGVRTLGLGLGPDAPKELLQDSQPANWEIATKRLDDLVTALAALGLFAASAGTASALIAAGLAAKRLIARMQNGHLELDAATVTDALTLLGGFGAATEIAGLRVKALGQAFTVMRDGEATAEQLEAAARLLARGEDIARVAEFANAAIGYAGLFWGELTFIDKMASINQQENATPPTLTHAAARAQRAAALSSAVQNNGFVAAGNIKKARDAAAAGKSPAAAHEASPHPGEGVSPEAAHPTPAKAPEEAATAADAAHAAAAKESTPAAAGEGAASGIREERPGAAEPGRPPAPTTVAARPERIFSISEQRGALPVELREMFIADDTLVGDDVRVDIIRDADRTILDAKIRVGPQARPATVAAHAATARTVQKYTGFAGSVRSLLGWLGEAIGLQTLNPANESLFEARLEVAKLPDLIDAQIERMRNAEPDARAEAEFELASLQDQFDDAVAIIRAGGRGQGLGFVAGRGVAKENARRYAQLAKEKAGLRRGSEKRKQVSWEMFKLLHPEGELAMFEERYERSRKADASVDEIRATMDWGYLEVSVTEETGIARRLDIADYSDPDHKRAVEVKKYARGYITATQEILAQLRDHGKLVAAGWDITWVLVDTRPSDPLLLEMMRAGVAIELRTSISPTTSRVQRLTPVSHRSKTL